MIRHCVEKWDKNHKRLEKILEKDTKLKSCEYRYLVELVVQHILNNGEDEFGYEWDVKRINTIDDGDYQGTLLFLIPLKTYQPNEYEYLMTYADYGSCSGCDALLEIQDQSIDDVVPTKKQLNNYMMLCKDLITNMIRPYNNGWRNNPDFNEVEYEKDC